MSTTEMRTSADADVRWEAARADRLAGRDLSWARTDDDAYVRLEAARADRLAGRDVSWARTDEADFVRLQAALADRRDGRDVSWARTDEDDRVRWEAASADRRAGRDLSWARADGDAEVRRQAASADYRGDAPSKWGASGVLHSATDEDKGSDDWRTPREFFEAFRTRYDLTIDAAASEANAMLPRYWTKQRDALSLSWRQQDRRARVWVNPPYGRGIGKWIAKAVEESRQGLTVVLLTFARTDTRWWHDLVLPNATAIWFVRGRLHFVQPTGKTGPAPAPSVVLVFSPARGYGEGEALRVFSCDREGRQL